MNLDATFKNQDYAVKEAVVIYSIVNSLSEQSSISQVQISVNGDTSGAYRDTYKLSDFYVRNLDYVTTLEAESTEDTESTENIESIESTESVDTSEEITETESTENTEE